MTPSGSASPLPHQAQAVAKSHRSLERLGAPAGMSFDASSIDAPWDRMACAKRTIPASVRMSTGSSLHVSSATEHPPLNPRPSPPRGA